MIKFFFIKTYFVHKYLIFYSFPAFKALIAEKQKFCFFGEIAKQKSKLL
tara:strand:- start:60 stop:206 length:147 start_codon:yes stop_codon:yes gene_type:complete